MRCEEIMKRDVECIFPQDTVQAAARRMRDENLGFLPVCDRSKKVLGALTDRDLAIRVLSDGRSASTSVEDVLTREVIACRPEDDLRKAEDLMAQNHKSRIMCLDGDGRLVGVISLSDIAQREDGARASQTLRQVSEREIRA
ncbi:MAG: CBS domain-containing protein [Myxococcales bacterium]